MIKKKKLRIIEINGFDCHTYEIKLCKWKKTVINYGFLFLKFTIQTLFIQSQIISVFINDIMVSTSM